MRAGEQRYVGMGGGRRAAEQLQKVQRAPLRGQKRASRAIGGKQNLIGNDGIAFGRAPLEGHARIDLAETLLDIRDAAEDRCLPRDHGGTAVSFRRDECRGEVAAADIFGQSRGNFEG